MATIVETAARILLAEEHNFSGTITFEDDRHQRWERIGSLESVRGTPANGVIVTEDTLESSIAAKQTCDVSFHPVPPQRASSSTAQNEPSTMLAKSKRKESADTPASAGGR